MTLNNIIADLRAQIDLCKTDEERVEIMNRVCEGWCRDCGALVPRNNSCHCENDE